MADWYLQDALKEQFGAEIVEGNTGRGFYSFKLKPEFEHLTELKCEGKVLGRSAAYRDVEYTGTKEAVLIEALKRYQEYHPAGYGTFAKQPKQLENGQWTIVVCIGLSSD